MAVLRVENYNKDGKILEPRNVTLTFTLLYTLLKKYMKEAIALADRVIVLTQRPATIKKEYKIHLTDKSTQFQNRKCKEFNDYYDAIWRDLNET